MRFRDLTRHEEKKSRLSLRTDPVLGGADVLPAILPVINVLLGEGGVRVGFGKDQIVSHFLILLQSN